MEFKDIQVVWDQQKEEPQFVFDSDVLYARIEKVYIRTRRLHALEEWMFSIMAAVVGIVTISEPLLEHKEYHQLPIGAAFLFLSAFFLWNKLQRRRETPIYDQSFLGIIDISIFRLKSYSRWVKRANILFWTFTLITATVTFLLYHDSKPVWLWFGMMAMMLASYFGVRKQMRNKAQGIESLEALRKQLKS